MKVSRQARKVWGRSIGGAALLRGEASQGTKQLPAPHQKCTCALLIAVRYRSTARLACFDKQVAELQQAQERRELVVVDQGEVKEARTVRVQSAANQTDQAVEAGKDVTPA